MRVDFPQFSEPHTGKPASYSSCLWCQYTQDDGVFQKLQAWAMFRQLLVDAFTGS